MHFLPEQKKHKVDFNIYQNIFENDCTLNKIMIIFVATGTPHTQYISSCVQKLQICLVSAILCTCSAAWPFAFLFLFAMRSLAALKRHISQKSFFFCGSVMCLCSLRCPLNLFFDRMGLVWDIRVLFLPLFLGNVSFANCAVVLWELRYFIA